MSESNSTFSRLEDVILDESFPDVDLALRRGRHIDRDHADWYAFLCDGQAHLEAFYRRYGCELVRRNEGYFYLLPTSDRLGRRQLSLPEMLVGQALTLLYLDPATVQGGGVTTRADVLAHLASVMGTDSLIQALNPKRKRYDQRVAQETVRARVSEALRRLATLGFVDSVGEEQIRLRPALMRFAEPVRSAAAPAEALKQLVAAGEVVLASDEPETAEEAPSEADTDDDYPEVDLSGLDIGEDVQRREPGEPSGEFEYSDELERSDTPSYDDDDELEPDGDELEPHEELEPERDVPELEPERDELDDALESPDVPELDGHDSTRNEDEGERRD